MRNSLKVLSVLLLCVLPACRPEPLPEDDKGGQVDKPVPPPVPETGGYDDLNAYAPLKTYVDRSASPDFKLGVAVDVAEFLKKSVIYDLAVANFDEMTAGNAMKYSSVVRSDGTMDFTKVRNFINLAESAGLSVYGHTLAWHSQQRPEYLNGLIADKRMELPDGETTDRVLLEADFNNGSHPFINWGNGSVCTVSDGALKVSNTSAVQNWEAQFAYDFGSHFINGQKYRLTFRIRGTSAGSLGAGFQIIDGYRSAGDFAPVSFGTEWTDVSVSTTCNASGANRLVFSFGDFVGDIFIDDFRFMEEGVSYETVSMSPEEKKAVLTDAMDRWIAGMMEATAEKVSVWDAVNEAVSDSDHDSDGYYDLQSSRWGNRNDFYWQDYLGSVDYVRIVIDKARSHYAAHGGVKPLKLFINDYNLESDWDDNRKLKSLIRWIEIWESDGVTKIDGIGTQMHISCYENPSVQASKSEHIVKMFELMAATGKLVKVSELDMGYIDNSGKTLSIKEMKDQQYRAMADYYEFIVEKYLEIVPPAQQYGITHWSPVDSASELNSGGWRSGEPVGLWFSDYKRKYAYAGFAEGLAR